MDNIRLENTSMSNIIDKIQITYQGSITCVYRDNGVFS
jgi:hypothetical protein